MSVFVPIALIGWIPIVVVLFAMLPPRRAVITSFLMAWLLLPMAGYELEGLPNFTKMSATSLGVLLGIVLFDARRLGLFTPAWYDLPIAVWVLIPMASSLENGFGMYDGLSGCVDQLILWGIPYFVGRLYFTDLNGLRELAIGIFIGGLIYVPLCLYEIRMSPQLHNMVYGFHQHMFIQSRRYGGWRPTVFLQHGLAVGMWMATASLIGVWLWQTGSLRRVRNVPMAMLVPPLVMTTILCKSVGAVALLIIGFGALCIAKWSRSAKIAWLLLLLAPAYLTARIAFQWDAEQLITAAEEVGPDRAASVEMRVTNEEQIIQRSMQKPFFGWGRWGGYRVTDEDARVVTDSMWILALGQTGIIGLIAMIAVIMLPVALFIHRSRSRHWHRFAMAPAAGLGVLLIMFMLDSLFNSMLNPIYLLAAGGLAGLSALHIRRGSAL